MIFDTQDLLYITSVLLLIWFGLVEDRLNNARRILNPKEKNEAIKDLLRTYVWKT